MPRQPVPPTAGVPRRFAVLGRQLPFVAVFGVLVLALVVWRESEDVPWPATAPSPPGHGLVTMAP